MSDEDSKFKSTSQILNLSPFPHDPIREPFIKCSPPKISSELNATANSSNKTEEHSKIHKLEDSDSKTVNAERSLAKRQGLTPPKNCEETLTHHPKTNEFIQNKPSPAFAEIKNYASTHERKGSLPLAGHLSYTNLRPGDAHLINETTMCHRLVTQQLSQIHNVPFDNKQFWANFSNIIPTSSNKGPTNLAPFLTPNKPIEPQKKQPEDQPSHNNQNPPKSESHENNTQGLLKPLYNPLSNEMRGVETGSGVEKENKEEDSMGPNSEDNFSPDNIKGKNINKKKFRSCGNKFCKTDLSGWNSKFTRVKSENNTYMMLCTNCAKAHRKGQYCYYCKQIYLDNDDDGKDWVQCDFCKKWVHADCEQLNGDPKFKSVMNAKDFIYYCPKCKKMKNKATGPKRKSYDTLDYLGKQQKKKKRFEPSSYNMLYGSSSNFDPNEFPAKGSPRRIEEVHPYDTVLSTGNGNLADLKKVFFELPYSKQAGNNKKSTSGHPPNENSYNLIDHLMSTYGSKVTLSEVEIIHDLNKLRGIIDKNEELKIEGKSPGMEIEDKHEKNEKYSDDRGENNQQKGEMLEEDENDEENSEKSYEKDADDENNNSNHNSGSNQNQGKNGGNNGNNGKKKLSNNSKNYSLRKVNNSSSKPIAKNEGEDKNKEKIDSTRVLRNRKKNL